MPPAPCRQPSLMRTLDVAVHPSCSAVFTDAPHGTSSMGVWPVKTAGVSIGHPSSDESSSITGWGPPNFGDDHPRPFTSVVVGQLALPGDAALSALRVRHWARFEGAL